MSHTVAVTFLYVPDRGHMLAYIASHGYNQMNKSSCCDIGEAMLVHVDGPWHDPDEPVGLRIRTGVKIPEGADTFMQRLL